MNEGNFGRRRTDSLMGRIGQFWDWIDVRRIDIKVISLVILGGTIVVTRWAMGYAESSTRPGAEVGWIIAAVAGPYCALQAAAIGFLFRANGHSR